MSRFKCDNDINNDDDRFCMSPEEMVEEDYIKMQWFELREIDEILSTSWPKQ